MISSRNQSAAGNGGICVLFTAGRLWPALPERYRERNAWDSRACLGVIPAAFGRESELAWEWPVIVV